MAKSSEEISKFNSISGGKPDSNLSNDSNHLGGIPANDYATQKYVQDYHGNKEKILKEYIDQQDQAKLQEAKAYADQIVSGQDFSSFAKVTDVQAVDSKLSKKITEESATQKGYTDSKIQDVVNDVNSNFSDVNNSIIGINNSLKQINSNQSDLFQSVSNGKATVAAAITDKGVATASDASFNTMAGNIRRIPTSTGGSGEVDPNFVNTSDATATASDIAVGKTAYAQGNKVYGTLIAQSEVGQPTYGLDTSDATAYSSDILYGKTAYARGQKVTGSLRNADVEEIYGIVQDSYIMSSSLETSIRVGVDDITKRKLLTFSKDLNFSVSVGYFSDDENDYCIESFPVDKKLGLFVYGVAGSDETKYKKYRYTKSELGLAEKEVVMNIAFGCGGLFGNSSKCLLIFFTKNTITLEDGTTKTESKIHVYTYHLSENGVIGKMYDNESDVIDNLEYVFTGGAQNFILTFNHKCNIFYLFYSRYQGYGYYCTIYKCFINNDKQLLVTESTVETSSSANFSRGSIFTFLSEDDKYLTSFNRSNAQGNTNVPFIAIDTETYDVKVFSMGFYTRGQEVNINGSNMFIRNDYRALTLISHSINGSSYTTETIKTLYTELDSGEYISNFVLSPDNTKMICITNSKDYWYISVLNIENITINDETVVKREYKYILEPHSSAYLYRICKGDGGSYILSYVGDNEYSKTMAVLTAEFDKNNVVGIKYKDKYFYNIPSNVLTAGQGDVRTGKTFVGWMGYPEIGNMEVT